MQASFPFSEAYQRDHPGRAGRAGGCALKKLLNYYLYLLVTSTYFLYLLIIYLLNGYFIFRPGSWLYLCNIAILALEQVNLVILALK